LQQTNTSIPGKFGKIVMVEMTLEREVNQARWRRPGVVPLLKEADTTGNAT